MADPFSTTASFVGNLISNLFNFGSTKKTNEQNLQIAREVNEAQRMLQDMANQANIAIANATNQANIGMQRETNQTNIDMVRETNLQQRQLQHEAWQREDNATQRRVADLRSAGLNPVLAAGSAAQASGPIQLNTPRAESPQMRHMAQMQAAQLKAAHMQIAQIETDMVERALRMRDDFATNAKTRQLLEATAEEHRVKTDEIKRLNMEAGKTWPLRLEQLRTAVSLQGKDLVLKDLEQEHRVLANKGQLEVNRGIVLENVKRAVENEFARDSRSRDLTYKDLQIASLAISNSVEEFEHSIRKRLGVTNQGHLYEKIVQALTGPELNKWVRHKTDSLLEVLNRSNTGSTTRQVQDWMHQMY